MREIRWHGRGGQGAKTAAQLLAAALLESGRSVQAFPEYGPERSGAPMQAYNRSDDRPIRRHCAVTQPDVVVVLDEALLGEVEVTAGLEPDGLLLVNTESTPARLRDRLGYPGTILSIPGNRLASEANARYANVVLLGGLAGASGEPSLAALEAATREVLGPKLGDEVLARTLAAMEAGHRSGTRGGVQSESEVVV